MDDATLIVQIAASNTFAITEFSARWFPQFARLATRMTGNEHDGEDIAQEAIVRVIMGAGKYQPGRSARAWLLAIVYHLVYDAARRKKIRKATSITESHESDGGPGALDIEGREPTAEERALAHEREDAVRASLAKLSEDDRNVILLRDYEGLNGPETAQALGITVEQVGGRLFRARKRLGALLQTEWPGLFPTHDL